MRRNLLTLALAVGSTTLAHGSSFTYNVHDVFSSFSVSGTITTDTNSGVLSTADLTGWDLLLNDGSQTLEVDTQNSQELVIGGGLTATAAGLFFDFGSSAGDQLIFQRPYIMYGTNDLCYQDQGGGCDAVDGAHEAIMIRSGAEQVQAENGVQEIAAAATAVTPEPASLSLFGTGLLGLAAAVRRKVLA